MAVSCKIRQNNISQRSVQQFPNYKSTGGWTDYLIRFIGTLEEC